MTGGAASVLVVANRSDPDPGFVGDRFEQLGYRLQTSWREGGLPHSPPEGVGYVLLLGSGWSVARPVAPGPLADECALVRGAADAGVPVLGLCYGAQVMALAHGGQVRTAPTPEVGLVPVETRDERLVPRGPWWQFHSDVIDVPDQATLVASNDCGAQAFTVGSSLGVQFHPEVRPSVLDDWLHRLPAMAAAANRPPEELVAQAEARCEETRAAAHALVDEFLARAEAGRRSPD